MVDRYDISGATDGERAWYVADRHPEGDWVSYSDFATLEAENHNLRAKLETVEAETRERAISAAEHVGSFGDYTRDELTADYGQPRFDMMNDIIAAIRNLEPHHD
jgi:hypothetical protein